MCKAELRDLFALHDDMPSHLHSKLMVEKDAAVRGEIDEGSDDDDDGGGKAKTTGGMRGGAARVEGMSEYYKEQEGWPKETGDMHLWGHHLGTENVDDAVLRDAAKTQSDGEGTVSFVFSLQVQGKLEAKGSQPAAPPRPPQAKGWLHLPTKGGAGQPVGGIARGGAGGGAPAACVGVRGATDGDDDAESAEMADEKCGSSDEGGGSDEGDASGDGSDEDGGVPRGGGGALPHRGGGARGAPTHSRQTGAARPSVVVSRALPCAPQVQGKLKVEANGDSPAGGGKENAAVRTRSADGSNAPIDAPHSPDVCVCVRPQAQSKKPLHPRGPKAFSVPRKAGASGLSKPPGGAGAGAGAPSGAAASSAAAGATSGGSSSNAPSKRSACCELASLVPPLLLSSPLTRDGDDLYLWTRVRRG